MCFFKVHDSASKWTKETVAVNLRKALNDGVPVEIDERFYIKLPSLEEHADHLMGEVIYQIY